MMSIAHYDRLPQGTTPNIPYWVENTDKNTGEITSKLLANVFVGRDPLTSRAYFDTVDLTQQYRTIERYWQRQISTQTWRNFELSIHADMLKIKSYDIVSGLSRTNGGGGKRGTVRGFSRASRKRMIEFLSSARVVGQLLFATFTYPDEFPAGDERRWQADFEALRRRIERQYPNYRIVWRQELQKRKSGQSEGLLAPHWHLIIDTAIAGSPTITVEQAVSYGKTYPKTTSPISRSFEAWALQAWYEIVGSGDAKHLHHGNFTVACRNRLHAYKYVSKYVAKIELDDYEIGRRWGRIGSWDTSASATVFLTKREYIELMRLAVRWMKSKGSDYAKQLAKRNRSVGATLFGLGDLARSGDLWRQLINHASELAAELPQLE